MQQGFEPRENEEILRISISGHRGVHDRPQLRSGRVYSTRPSAIPGYSPAASDHSLSRLILVLGRFRLATGLQVYLYCCLLGHQFPLVSAAFLESEL